MTACSNQPECQNRCEANRAALEKKLDRRLGELKDDLETQIQTTKEDLEYDRDELKKWLQRLDTRMSWLLIEILLGFLGIIAAIIGVFGGKQ